MRYNVIGYLLSEGFHNVMKNKKSTGASLMIMCATMLIFGLFFLIGENVNHMMKELEANQGMQVFMTKKVSDDQIQELEEKIKDLPDVAKVEFISKEQGMNTFKERYGENARILDAYVGDDNPITDSFVVTLTNLEKSEEVKTQIEGFENVKNIELRDKTIEALIKVTNGVRIVSAVILVLLIVISVFIIANTIKLTVHARRKEISIMKYVGATNGFIRWPFIVEGIIIGVVAALISVLLLGIAYNSLMGQITSSEVFSNMGLSLLTFSEIFGLIITVYLILGTGIGALGSIISMRKYLEV